VRPWGRPHTDSQTNKGGSRALPSGFARQAGLGPGASPAARRCTAILQAKITQNDPLERHARNLRERSAQRAEPGPTEQAHSLNVAGTGGRATSHSLHFGLQLGICSRELTRPAELATSGTAHPHPRIWQPPSQRRHPRGFLSSRTGHATSGSPSDIQLPQRHLCGAARPSRPS
jgi:hypothetical protein